MARNRFATGRQAAFAYFSLPRKVGRRRQDKPKASAKGNNRDAGATDRSFNRHSAPDGAAGRRGRRPLQSAVENPSVYGRTPGENAEAPPVASPVDSLPETEALHGGPMWASAPTGRVLIRKRTRNARPYTARHNFLQTLFKLPGFGDT